MENQIETTIPNQLESNEFKFILLNGKIPIEKEWQQKNNYQFDDQKLIQHINTGNNYGVACGYGNLLVIDTDAADAEKLVSKQIPKTFAVKTGSKEEYKKHFYFICKDAQKTIHIPEFADIQWKGAQVVGATSTHPDTGIQYTILENIPIAEISFDQILNVFQEKIVARCIVKNILMIVHVMNVKIEDWYNGI